MSPINARFQRPPLPTLITTEPEQTFLGKHYETLQKDPNRDPRAQFKPDAATTQAVAGTPNRRFVFHKLTLKLYRCWSRGPNGQ